MKSNLREQFQNIKDIINTNIKAIKSLTEQSKLMEELIKNSSNITAKDETTAKLEEIKKNVDKSIETLTQETKELFVALDTLVNELFY
jgi:DNA-directed RNA polymerase sigma subunit (sigma70/sigma32)